MSTERVPRREGRVDLNEAGRAVAALARAEGLPYPWNVRAGGHKETILSLTFRSVAECRAWAWAMCLNQSETFVYEDDARGAFADGVWQGWYMQVTGVTKPSELHPAPDAETRALADEVTAQVLAEPAEPKRCASQWYGQQCPDPAIDGDVNCTHHSTRCTWCGTTGPAVAPASPGEPSCQFCGAFTPASVEQAASVTA